MAQINYPKILPFSSPLSGAKQVGIATASPLKTIPGIISNVNSLSSLCSAEDMMVMFPARATLSAFVKETGLPRAFITPVLHGPVPFTQAITTLGFRNEFQDIVTSITDVDSEEKYIRVPIGELHCPKIHGCKATYTQETQNEQDNFIEISILGIGGGDNKTISVGFGYKVTAKEQCLRFLQEMKFKFSNKKWKKGNKFTTVEVVEVTHNYFQELIPNCPTCGKEYNRIKNSRDYQGHGEYHIIADTSIIEKINNNTGTGFSLGIDFSELFIKSKIKISTKVIKEIKCEYELVGGYDYIGYNPKPKSSLFCWTWSRQ
jgi:hypothetical protein